MKGYTVQVNNVSSRATVRDIQNFFSFSGQIHNVDLRRDGHWSQVAYVTFTDPDSVDTAVLLSGATIIDQPVSIISLEDHDQEAAWEHEAVQPVSMSAPTQAVNRAQDMVTKMLSKGYVLGKDVLNKAKAFDERHQITLNASSRMASMNRKVGLSDKWNSGTSSVNKHLRAVNDKYQITEKTKSAFVLAQQGVVSAGCTLMNNKYVMVGGSWVSGAFHKVAKAASDVGHMRKDKMHLSESPRLSAEA